ncbi:MAG: PEP-CTERM sorting domain-containing protein [Piscinibacter sp.]|nr:PEP-CTERM sorting domain-containing protein [Piscinibacter sp.]
MVPKSLIAAGAGALLVSATSAGAVTMYADLASWSVHVSTFQGTTVVRGPKYSVPSSIVLGGGSVIDSFSSGVMKVPVGDASCPTWPDMPGSLGTSVFLSRDKHSVTMNFGGGAVLQADREMPVDAFGVYIQPEPYIVKTLTLSLASGESLTQQVHGEGGARFFGWTGLDATSITISGDSAFAFGQFYEGHTASVPEPQTLALMLGGLGIFVVAARRRRIRLHC